MQLADYLVRKSMNQTMFAEKLNASESTVSRVLKGLGCSRNMATRIEKATDGDVSRAEVLAAQRDSPKLDGEPDRRVVG
ncbi:MAG: hypothetical protein ABL901_01055 [Hyphomicrobiaceae bacterium]